MRSTTPIRDGFRTTWRVPGIVPAEVAWRWAAGAAFWALAVLAFVEYADSLKVSRGNWFLWKLGYPPLLVEAFADTIAGSGHKLLAAAAVVVPGTAVIWMVAAAFGRTATLGAIMPGRAVRFRTMLGLNFLRATATLAALVGLAGVFAIAMRLYSDGPGAVPHAERATWIMIVGWFLVAYFWAVANWFLSFALVVAAELDCDALTAIVGAVQAFQERTGAFLRVNTIFGGLHVLVFVLFSGLSFFAFAIAASISGTAVLIGMSLTTLLYFFVADYFYVARLAAYAALIATQR